MNFLVDEFKKVTISFGGKCPLKCNHCYTNCSQFSHTPSMSIKKVLYELKSINKLFYTICISGDIDALINPDNTIGLLKELVVKYPHTDIMFTSRLVPESRYLYEIYDIGDTMAHNHKLLIPGVSIIKDPVPNDIELSPLIPSVKERLNLIQKYAENGLPTFLALRPTFPFSIVPKKNVIDIIQSSARYTSAFLGEAFILDTDDEIISKLQNVKELKASASIISKLSFLNQPTGWRKIILHDEVKFIRSICNDFSRPYFIRSISALKFLKQYWDFKERILKYKKGYAIDYKYENIIP